MPRARSEASRTSIRGFQDLDSYCKRGSASTLSEASRTSIRGLELDPRPRGPRSEASKTSILIVKGDCPRARSEASSSIRGLVYLDPKPRGARSEASSSIRGLELYPRLRARSEASRISIRGLEDLDSYCKRGL